MGFLKIPGLGTVHYHEYGSGTKPMLAFHGYGMTGKQFQVLEASVLSEYRVYGFDHFFHGESKLDGWTEQQILAGMPRKMVKAYVEEWFNIYGRQRISLMAYSIGANHALIILEEYADLVDEVILMAPDGIAGYKGFNFLQHHLAGRMLFNTATKSKWLMPGILKTLKRFKAIDDSLYTIAYNEVDTQRKREDVFYTLNLIRFLQPDMPKVVALINQHDVRCRLIFGRDDMLFPRKAAEHLVAQINNAEVYEVPMGHWLVTKELDNYLVNLVV
jgi:pimeloyl-ACP methyl ester carboxylesterase